MTAEWQAGSHVTLGLGVKRGAEALTWPGGVSPCSTHHPFPPASKGLGGSWANCSCFLKVEKLLHKDTSEAAW